MASNRIGTEVSRTGQITFYGGSFIAGPRGEVVAQVRGEMKEDREEGYSFWGVGLALGARAVWGASHRR